VTTLVGFLSFRRAVRYARRAGAPSSSPTGRGTIRARERRSTPKTGTRGLPREGF
jgi:hypothetical protein